MIKRDMSVFKDYLDKKDTLNQVKDKLKNDNNTIMVVYGPTNSGKSYLLNRVKNELELDKKEDIIYMDYKQDCTMNYEEMIELGIHKRTRISSWYEEGTQFDNNRINSEFLYVKIGEMIDSKVVEKVFDDKDERELDTLYLILDHIDFGLSVTTIGTLIYDLRHYVRRLNDEYDVEVKILLSAASYDTIFMLCKEGRFEGISYLDISDLKFEKPKNYEDYFNKTRHNKNHFKN